MRPPEERLATAARWTARSLEAARHLGEDPALLSAILRMHGNELRKAGIRGAAVERLRHAVAIAPSLDDRAAALPLLARAAGALGNRELFDAVMGQAERLLDTAAHTSLFNPYSLHEIRLRGLLATGRAHAAIRLAEEQPALTTTVAPQWRVIELITVAQVRLIGEDRAGAAEALEVALGEAMVQRLPHQVQRILRAAGQRLSDIHAVAGEALDRMRQEMAA